MAMFHVCCLEAPACSASAAVRFNRKRRDLAIPTSEATPSNLREVGNITVDNDVFASEFDIAIEYDGCTPEHTDRRDAVTPVAGTSEIANIGAKTKALFSSTEVGTIIDTNTIRDPVRPAKWIISPAVIPAIVSPAVIIRRHTQ